MSTAADKIHTIEVDTDAADHAKGVTRVDPKAAKGGGVANDGKDTEERLDNWFNKNKYVAKRMARFGNNLRKEFDQQRADDEARHQKELREIREQLHSLKTNSDTASTDAAHEAEIAALQAKLEAAIEAGDTKEQARLQTLIARTESAHVEARTKALIGANRREEKPETARQTEQNRNAPSKKAAAFIAQTDWWDDPEFEAEQAYANRLFAKLTTEEGMDPEDDATYRRINKKLKAKFPALKVRDPGELDDDLDDDEEELGAGLDGKPSRRAPVTQFRDRGTQQATQRRGTVQLTDDDIATMRAMKLDPNDNSAVMAFAKARRERLEAEGA